jgi:flagellar biosynthesis/type III secretory pathway protein FliH
MKRDVEQEARAEEKVTSIFPQVAVITGTDGAKLIPVGETVKIIQSFEDRIEAARREGYEEGYQAGLSQGRAEGQAKAEQVVRQFDQAIKETVTQREALLNEARDKILDLVIQISRKVTFDAVSADPEATLAIINGAIDTLADRSRLKVKVNPEHLPVVKQHIERYLKDPDILNEITIEADARVRYGGCLIETPTEEVDARVESQMEVVQEAILTGEGEH